MRGPANIRRIVGQALLALIVGIGVLTLVDGYSSSGAVKSLQVLAVLITGAAVIVGVVVLALVHLAGWHSPASEDEFERIVQRSERLAAQGSWGDSEDYEQLGSDDADDHRDGAGLDEDEFRTLLRAAIDELPPECHVALEHVAIVVSDDGAAVRIGRGRRGAYGLYQGDTVARDHFHDRIVIFRDTLTRDFGHDPNRLREQITRTLRHELAHHLGWDERGVGGLGL